jgi:hypothetical protein
MAASEQEARRRIDAAVAEAGRTHTMIAPDVAPSVTTSEALCGTRTWRLGPMLGESSA